MSITEVLRSKAEPADKLASVVEIVKSVRESYGNTEAKITMPEVNTATGFLPLSALSDESKVEMASAAVNDILQEVIEIDNCNEGANTAKVAESMIATNPILVNLGEKVSFGSL
jgi:hypothetical protein